MRIPDDGTTPDGATSRDGATAPDAATALDGGAAATPARRPVGERRQGLGRGPAGGDAEPPLTRREMKARGMVFTTELPVIVAPEADGGGETSPPGVASPAGAGPAPGATSSADDTSTDRRPVVRPPAAARAVLRLDETGTISAVQPVVEPAAPPTPAPDPLIDDGPTDVAASWESAVSTPPIVLGFTDRPDAAVDAAPPASAPTGLVAPPIRPPRRRSVRDPARERGVPGAPARPAPPEASTGWSSVLQDEAASTGTLLARVSASLSEQTSASLARTDDAASPAGESDAPPAVPDGERRGPVSAGTAVGEPAPNQPAPSEPAPVTGPAVPGLELHEPGHERRWWPESGVVRFVLLLTIGVVLGLAILFVANGSLGDVFATGLGPPATPGAPSVLAPPR